MHLFIPFGSLKTGDPEVLQQECQDHSLFNASRLTEGLIYPISDHRIIRPHSHSKVCAMSLAFDSSNLVFLTRSSVAVACLSRPLAPLDLSWRPRLQVFPGWQISQNDVCRDQFHGNFFCSFSPDLWKHLVLARELNVSARKLVWTCERCDRRSEGIFVASFREKLDSPHACE